jgi:hypothetical protein
MELFFIILVSTIVGAGFGYNLGRTSTRQQNPRIGVAERPYGTTPAEAAAPAKDQAGPVIISKASRRSVPGRRSRNTGR